MPRPATDKRDRLTDAALDLAYRQGFERASIAEIATHAGVASGSVYYYFKTKDDVAAAVGGRLAAMYSGRMEQWAALESPVERLLAYATSYVDDADQVQEFGCPLGSVAAELGKVSPAAGESAGEVFRLLLEWAAGQFREMGFGARAAEARATHLISIMQGAAALSAALGSPEPIEREAAHVETWLRSSAESR